LALRREGSFAKGKEVVEEALAEMGIAAGTYAYADGSGLSRQNLESADSLVRLLRYMRQHQYFEVFYDALPVAGVDGTLSERLKKERTKKNVHAKTGSMANVSTISGYVRTADGELLAFSISVNNSLAPKELAESIQDKAIERLADFSRNK
jgi:D-alanyl-D-alanine carboxypeptidase/D-alanyl-D-alanine-endopeptidase (penicillin-binding protein 4)